MIEILSCKGIEYSGIYPICNANNITDNETIYLFNDETLTQKQYFEKLDYCLSCAFKEYNVNAFKIAEILYKVHEKSLYTVGGYKNIYDYTFQKYGLSKTTVKNYKNVIYFFYDLKEMKIIKRYINYSITQLILMCHVPHENLLKLGIDSSWSCSQIKKAISKWRKENNSIESVEGSGQSPDPETDGQTQVETDNQEKIQYKVIKSGKYNKYQFKNKHFITEKEFDEQILKQIHDMQKINSNVVITVQSY